MIDQTVSVGNLLTLGGIIAHFAYNALKGSFVAGREKEHYANLQESNQREFNAINKKLDAQDAALVTKARDIEGVQQRAFAEISKKLDSQDTAFKERTKADVLSDGILLLLQHRVTSLESEVVRCRENIHRIANHVQVEVARLAKVDQKEDGV